MSEIVIRCEGLSKQYRIGQQERYKALRDVLTDAAAAPFRRLVAAFSNGNGISATRHSKLETRNSETIWALDDVSFEVKRGEVVGIIGSNGAGKSTLLKILSRITKPTKGHAEIHGRIGSLLEVGTGFHPELTGRENVYLNGAILGMRKVEIDRKFDEIVSFAEIEKFIDTPVKRYSSGMYVRLAFAVAAHMETEVLLVDEVLAVGDAQFQKKCFEKMREIGKGGRTILFVSHNMSAVRNICHSGIVLEEGHLVDEAEINAAVDNYLARLRDIPAPNSIVETRSFIVNEVEIYSNDGPTIKTFDSVEIRVRFTPKIDVVDPGLYVGVLSLDGRRITGLDFRDFQASSPIKAGQCRELGFSLRELPILPGSYQLEIHLKDMADETIEIVAKTFVFEVVETPIYGGRKLDGWFGHVGLNAKAFSASPDSDPSA
jgi:ABC-type polysaccharide/polyol phosphate transport system ATPase subunit